MTRGTGLPRPLRVAVAAERPMPYWHAAAVGRVVPAAAAAPVPVAGRRDRRGGGNCAAARIAADCRHQLEGGGAEADGGGRSAGELARGRGGGGNGLVGKPHRGDRRRRLLHDGGVSGAEAAQIALPGLPAKQITTSSACASVVESGQVNGLVTSAVVLAGFLSSGEAAERPLEHRRDDCRVRCRWLSPQRGTE